MPAPWKSVCFLHGLASSPAGTKAEFFRRQFAEEGLPYLAPDLNVPDFTHQTLTDQLEVVRRAVASLPGPVLLMGSSLGGLAAIRYAELNPEDVGGVVVIAPVMEFRGERLAAMAGSTLREWEEVGTIRLERDGSTVLLGYDLVRDAPRHVVHDVVLNAPVLAIHGTSDDLVPWQESDRFISRQKDGSSSLLVNGDHSLNQHLELLWTLMGNWRIRAASRNKRGRGGCGGCGGGCGGH